MSCPTGKIPFNTKLSAWQASIKKGNKYNTTFAPYHCTFCQKIHLTKRKDTIKGSTMPYKVGLRLNTFNGEIIKKKYKRHKAYHLQTKKMPKSKDTTEPNILVGVPEWKKKILRFVIKLLKIKK